MTDEPQRPIGPPSICQCGRKLKRHPNHSEIVGHPGRCEFGEPYFDGTRLKEDERG